MYIPDNLIRHWAGLSNDAASAKPVVTPFTLHSGQSLSDAVVVPDGMRPLGLTLPSNWTSSSLSFQISYDGAEFFETMDGYSTMAPLVFTGAVASIALYIPTWSLLRGQAIKVRSGSLASPTVQGGDRVMQLVCIFATAVDH
jgi:hypothetical protein